MNHARHCSGTLEITICLIGLDGRGFSRPKIRITLEAKDFLTAAHEIPGS